MAVLTCLLIGLCATFALSYDPLQVCKDIKVENCATWKRNGLCNSAYYRRYMKENCFKSCGYCGDPCGRPDVAPSRGTYDPTALRGSWPWQILLFFNEKAVCGGAIISSRWILTAAKCVSRLEVYRRKFKVRVGDDINSANMSVERIISHQMYSGSTLYHNIALVKLSSPIQFGTYIKPVCLPKDGRYVPIRTKCFITGWGMNTQSGTMHQTLQQGQMPVVSRSDCAKVNTFKFGQSITDLMLCAGHRGRTRAIGCHGDIGAPFVCQTGVSGSWELHGAMSWGSGRCDATQGYTVFTRVAVYRNWINQQLSRY